MQAGLAGLLGLAGSANVQVKREGILHADRVLSNQPLTVWPCGSVEYDIHANKILQ